jgi:RNA polymerase sigma factor (sigma-70 family)
LFARSVADGVNLSPRSIVVSTGTHESTVMREAEHDLLVLQARAGRRTALDSLVSLHHADVVRYAFSLCDDIALARDAVQEAWLTVVRRLRRLDDPRAFRSWLYHAVRWRTLDAVRRRTRRAETAIDEVHEGDLTASDRENDESETRDRRLSLDAALSALPEIERETIQLFYRRGLALREIAHVQEVPIGTVKSRLHRARRQLEDTIEGDSP